MVQQDRRAQPMLPARYEDDDNDIAVIMGIINDRKWIILGFFWAALAMAFIYVVKAKPQFTAMTTIMVSAPQTSVSHDDMYAAGSSASADIVDLRSRIEILKSPSMIRRLISETKLFQSADIGGSNNILSFDDISAKGRAIMVSQVKRRLSVKPVLGTSLVEVTYRSYDPLRAAYIANTLVKIYMDQQAAARQEKTRRVSDWLARRLDVLRAEVKNVELALEAARQKAALPDENGLDSRLRQMTLLSAQLATVEAESANAKALLETLDSLDKNKQVSNAADNFVQNTTFISLKEKITDLERDRAALSQKYGPKHPSMQAVQKQIDVLQQTFDDEIDMIRAKAQIQVDVSQATIRDLKKRIAGYRDDYQSDASARLSIRDLESDAVTARALFDDFMASYRESLQNLDFQQSDMTIISPATPPVAMSYPNKPLIIGLCSITGLFIGIFIALILEKIHNVFQSVSQIERMTNIPVYGVLTRAKKMKGINPADYIIGSPAVGLAELVRSLYMAFRLRDPRKSGGGRVLTVTSTVANEGKTTISSWLATIAAQNGDKVLIIDADMRRPSVHKSYEIGNVKGLADYLSDRLPLDDVIYRNHPSGVHIMTSKAIPTHALTLLTSERMESMIRRLRDLYDLIIIDAPTSLVFSDARVLAKLSDKTFYVVEWKKTRRDIFMASVKQFTDMGYKDVAIVLNKADIDHYASKKKENLGYLHQVK